MTINKQTVLSHIAVKLLNIKDKKIKLKSSNIHTCTPA